MSRHERVERFRALHRTGTFVMPNEHDLGSTKLLESIGFDAIATTSAGLANTLGRLDSSVTRDALVDHVRTISAATDLPLNVDAERCYPDLPGGVTATIEMLADAGAAGCSIEDWNPVDGRIEPIDLAVERVAEAVAAADRVGLVLTARAENHIRGVTDIDDTVRRLRRFADAGATCVYAPGLVDPALIERVVVETGAAVNVLLFPNGPSVAELAALGVRRISVGSFLASIAYGAFTAAAQRLHDDGTIAPDAPFLTGETSKRAFVM